MSNRIKILLLEDSLSDSELTKREIFKSGLEAEILWVENGPQFIENLKTFKPDLVLSDYSLPQFTGMEALRICREYNPNLPFILVTGSLNEEIAVECMKSGSDDYVLKESIARLGSAINSAIEKRKILQAKMETEEALKKSEEKYRTIFENVQDVFYQISCDGTIIDISPSIKQHVDIERNEIVGKNVINFYYEPSERKNFLSTIIEKGEVRDYEVILKTKDGKLKYASINARLIKNDETNECHIDGALRDITERKIAEQKVKILSRSVEQSPVIIIITDNSGIIEYVNPKFIEFTGYDLNEVVGKNPRYFRMDKIDNDEFKKLWDTILQGEEWHGEFYNRKKNGEEYWVNASISPIVDEQNEITHFIAIFEDITEKKKMISELIAAKERAEKSDRLKSEFLAQMSHEIRTPVNIISSNAEFIREELEGKIAEELHDIFDAIDSSSDRIIRTIDLILNMSEVQAGLYSSTPQMLDINKDILQNICKEHKQLASKKNLEFFYSIKTDKTRIFADKYSIDQIFTNLLDNAIKYTKTGSVKVEVVNNNNGETEVSIIDTGKGISKEFMPHLFEPFMQEEQGYSRSFEGNGLGLALVKKYCEVNNAQIFVDSVQGKGSTFTVVLKNNYNKITRI